MQKITSFLMFTGQAEEAMNFYVSLFEDSRIDNIVRGEGGTVTHARFTLNGQQFICIDSPAVHAFTFTAAMSLYIDCSSEVEIDRLFSALSTDGSILMPLAAYPFSKKYAWINDKFGVSWQLSYNS